MNYWIFLSMFDATICKWDYWAWKYFRKRSLKNVTSNLQRYCYSRRNSSWSSELSFFPSNKWRLILFWLSPLSFLVAKANSIVGFTQPVNWEHVWTQVKRKLAVHWQEMVSSILALPFILVAVCRPCKAADLEGSKRGGQSAAKFDNWHADLGSCLKWWMM